MILQFRKIQASQNLIEVRELRHGDWVNTIEPTDREISKLIREYKVPAEFVHASLDLKERSRIDILGKWKLFIIRIPIKQNGQFIIIPLGVIINEYNIFTICAKPNEVINRFLTDKMPGFYTSKRTRFVLFVIKNANKYFDQYVEELHEINSRTEHKLLRSERNAEVISFLEIQKTITYFHAALINNGVLFEKIFTNKKIEFFSADKEILEDMIVENKELLETVSIFMNNIGNTMDAYASIISNNLNITMKFLTSLTILLSLPTIITSFYGMNIALPFQGHPLAFLIIIVICFVLIIAGLYFFIRNNWL